MPLGFRKVLNWLECFITFSGHSDFATVVKPKDCPQSIIIEDEQIENTVNKGTDLSIENTFEGAKY